MKRKFFGFFVLSAILLCGQFIQAQMLKSADLKKKTVVIVKPGNMAGTAIVEGQISGRNTFMLYKHIEFGVSNYRTLAQQPAGFHGIVSGYLNVSTCSTYESKIYN